jgi:hypothetical protein
MKSPVDQLALSIDHRQAADSVLQQQMHRLRDRGVGLDRYEVSSRRALSWPSSSIFEIVIAASFRRSAG